MIFTIIIVFFSLIGLMALHEFGHFVIAKKCGVKVEEFGIGYPPRIIGKKIGQTLYSLNLLPFGAFVKIYGEEGGIESAQSFSEKPIWQRASIVIGGVVSFWLISAILLSIVFGLGVSQAISDEAEAKNPKVQIVAIAPGSPAEKAGIRLGDTIKEFSIAERHSGGEKEGTLFDTVPTQQFQINKVKEIQELTEKYRGEEITLTIERGKEIFTAPLVPRVSPPEGEGPMGVGLVRTVLTHYPWYLSPIKGIEASLSLTASIGSGLIEVFGNIVRGKGLPPGSQLMGPIGIGSLMTQVAQLGVSYYLQFVALISIYLAIFNLLPIPALDGGKLLFLGIEKIRKKPVSPKIEQNITGGFFTVLVALMIWVTIKDIMRLF